MAVRTITLTAFGGGGGRVLARRVHQADGLEGRGMLGYDIGDWARALCHAGDAAEYVTAEEPGVGREIVYPYSRPEGECGEYLTADEVHHLIMPREVAARWNGGGIGDQDRPLVAVVVPTHERGLPGAYYRPLSLWDEWAVNVGIVEHEEEQSRWRFTVTF